MDVIDNIVIFVNFIAVYTVAQEILIPSQKHWVPLPPSIRQRYVQQDISNLYRVNLGDDCTINSQCKAAYSVCVDKFCRCREKFYEVDKICEPTVHNCPTGVLVNAIPCTLKRGNIGGSKQLKAIPLRYNDWQDTCPDDQFCFVYQLPRTTSQSNGHCCSKPRSVCPMGEPHKSAICSRRFYFKSKSLRSSKKNTTSVEICPSDTHECLSTISINGLQSSQVCCPRECPLQHISHRGICLRLKNIDESCVTDGQCNHRQKHMQCSRSRCSCRKGFYKIGNSCSVPKCPSITDLLHDSLTDLEGIPIHCNASANCPAQYHCTVNNLCCETPEPSCPHGLTLWMGQTGRPTPCNPMDFKSNPCRGDSICLQFYFPIKGPSEDTSICCQTEKSSSRNVREKENIFKMRGASFTVKPNHNLNINMNRNTPFIITAGPEPEAVPNSYREFRQIALESNVVEISKQK